MQPKTWITAGLAALLFTSASATAAMAASAQAQVVVSSPELARENGVKAAYERMIREGYRYIEISRSMLGRAVVEAWDGAHRREVVVNTTSGEILHDMTEAYAGYPEGARAAASDAADTAANTATDLANSAVDTASGLAGVAAGMGDSVAGGGFGGFGN